MGPVHVTEGKWQQTKMYTHCQWCVKGNAAGMEFSVYGLVSNHTKQNKRN